MANELDRFIQIMGNLDAQNAVKQVMTLFSSINKMNDDELLVLAQTIDFYEGRLPQYGLYVCRKFKTAIRGRFSSNIFLEVGPVKQRIVSLCKK